MFLMIVRMKFDSRHAFSFIFSQEVVGPIIWRTNRYNMFWGFFVLCVYAKATDKSGF